MRRSHCPIPQWRNRIALAFALPPSAPDPETLAVTEALRDLRRDNVRTVGAVTESFLAGRTDPLAAAAALSDEAERCIREALAIASASIARRLGPAPGRCVVLALGGLGGRELRFGSDLDLMLVFERAGEGYCPLAAAYFEELARALVGALSYHSVLGSFYEVDLRLRPHGDHGVLAVELQAFRSYYLETCWTWELQALTRARPVAGDPDLGRRVMSARREAIGHGLGRPAGRILEDIREMRDLLEQEQPAATDWDVKRAPGGLIDIEFIAQALQLTVGAKAPTLPHHATPEALRRLARRGLLDVDDASVLGRSWALQLLILQHQRAMAVGPAALVEQPPARLATLLRSAGAQTIKALNRERANAQRATRRLLHRLIGTEASARIAA